jgi:hypothetical protein
MTGKAVHPETWLARLSPLVAAAALLGLWGAIGIACGALAEATGEALGTGPGPGFAVNLVASTLATGAMLGLIVLADPRGRS